MRSLLAKCNHGNRRTSIAGPGTILKLNSFIFSFEKQHPIALGRQVTGKIFITGKYRNMG